MFKILTIAFLIFKRKRELSDSGRPLSTERGVQSSPQETTRVVTILSSGQQTVEVAELQGMAKDSAVQSLPAGPSLPIDHCY